jgi:hypothetical protein
MIKGANPPKILTVLANLTKKLSTETVFNSTLKARLDQWTITREAAMLYIHSLITYKSK